MSFAIISKVLFGVTTTALTTVGAIYVIDKELLNFYDDVFIFATTKGSDAVTADASTKDNTCKLTGQDNVEEFDCEIYMVDSTQITEKKHIKIKEFTEKKSSTDIKADSYYKIQVSKKMWNTLTKKDNKDKKFVFGKGNKELKMLFTSTENYELITYEGEQINQSLVGKAIKETASNATEITKSSNSDKSYQCTSQTKEKFEDCKIYDFEENNTNSNLDSAKFNKNSNESAKVSENKYYLIEKVDLTYDKIYVKTEGSTDNKKIQITELQQTIVTDDLLFMFEKNK